VTRGDRSPRVLSCRSTGVAYVGRPPPFRVEARHGSLVAPPEVLESSSVVRPRSPAAVLALVRLPSPSESVSMTSSALLASGAPPSLLGTASGFSSSLPGPENVNPPSSSLGVESLLNALSAEPPPTPFTGPTPQAESCRSRAVGRLSWGSCSHERNYVGCPLLSPNRPEGRLVRARVAKPPPVPSSGFLPLSTVQALYARGAFETLADPAVCRGPRRFAALFHAARVPGTALQSFPFPRSRAHSRGPLLPCAFVTDHRRRRAVRSSRSLSPLRQALCPDDPPGGGPWTHEPGTRVSRVR
jgi:hypothetical protein